ncbi:MAG: FAD-binding oxidoreductase [Sylvanvirus sp.]|uniref:FAD-binding oxidoreductase n=1 Tax=Sylvanvirus sp. TaxID=2487774 RepID=A0A3G5AHT0_9VIRU|nr:MAG: FAD-binding oxidoreductase [Sylvanvirus sp.]
MYANDASELNRTLVSQVFRPTHIDDLQHFVQRTNPKPICIRGAGYSLGGQTLYPNAILIDMALLHRISDLKVLKRRVTVEAGCTWRHLQRVIDPHQLSVQIMQSYACFSIGGAISVNCHGRYAGKGALITSIRWIDVIVAKGDLIRASRYSHKHLFYGCIGGYGGLGIIVRACLKLDLNEKLQRQVIRTPLSDYPHYFQSHRRDIDSTSSPLVFHNADISLPDFKQATIINWKRVSIETPVTEQARLKPVHVQTMWERLVRAWYTASEFTKSLRFHLVDPLQLQDRAVVWRNFEAGYDVAELMPLTTMGVTTYSLQEYFVPIQHFQSFTRLLKQILTQYAVNVSNISIRHVPADKESLLSWCPQEGFAFVLFYWHSLVMLDDSFQYVRMWSRVLIDAALELGGSFYMPYQVYATVMQFKKAYPRHKEFFVLKENIDPCNRFRNHLWKEYYRKDSL